MYQYKHKKMNREEFEAAFKRYINSNGYTFHEWTMWREWSYYERGRSWFAALIDYNLEHGGPTYLTEETSWRYEHGNSH